MAIDTEAGPCSVGLGMLSWRAPTTVDHTLASYAREDIFGLFDQVLLYCQEITDADREIAAKYGIECSGNHRNRGICGGVRALLEAMDTDYVLMVENDCVLLEDRDEVAHQLRSAVKDMAAGRAQVFRLRHRVQPGEDFHTVDKYRRYHLPSDPDAPPRQTRGQAPCRPASRQGRTPQGHRRLCGSPPRTAISRRVSENSGRQSHRSPKTPQLDQPVDPGGPALDA